MDYKLFKIDELYRLSDTKLDAVDSSPKLFVALYYYVAATIGYSEISRIFNSIDSDHWLSKYNKYVAPARLRYSSDTMFKELQEAINITVEGDDLAKRVLNNSSKKFKQTVERSNIGQPEYSGIPVGVYSENSIEKAGLVH